jgi:hypothetical protein
MIAHAVRTSSPYGVPFFLGRRQQLGYLTDSEDAVALVYSSCQPGEPIPKQVGRGLAMDGSGVILQ